jgi:hypothetical protein
VSSRPVRRVFVVAMNILIACAALVTVRVGVRFFGQWSSQAWGKAVVALTSPLVINFGLHPIKTPYGGVFDVNAATVVVIYVVVEWVLSRVNHDS